MRYLLGALSMLPVLANAQPMSCSDSSDSVRRLQPCEIGAMVQSIDPSPFATPRPGLLLVAQSEKTTVGSQSKPAAERLYEKRKSQEGLTLGMSMADVLNNPVWGKPDGKTASQTMKGKREQWAYRIGEDRRVQRMYLYFNNEVLTTIQN